MDTITRIDVGTDKGTKRITVLCGDIKDLDRSLDVMTVSTFRNKYYPSKNTMIGALHEEGISVYDLAEKPMIDLRDFCSLWLSEPIHHAHLPIKRIACIEMLRLHSNPEKETEIEQSILSKIQAYFHLLDLASGLGVEINTLGLSIIGTGKQHIADTLIMLPMINECFRFLIRNDYAKEIVVIERNRQKAEQFATALQNSYSILSNTIKESSKVKVTDKQPLAFISYSSKDKNVADNLCSKLESNGIRVWYAPRDIDTSDYATSIVNAISRCSHFIVILSQHSLYSEHVLNEVDLAFQEIKRGVKFYPLKMDQEELGAAFKYYLSRQHWMDATLPPLEARLQEFVKKIKEELE